MASNLEAGKLGEHICMVHLMKLGIPCELIHLDTTDIVVRIDNTLLRVQVKSSALKWNGDRKKSYQFSTAHSGKKKPLTKDQCDIVAFVALDCERVMFVPVEYVRGQVTRRFAPAKFRKDFLESRSWEDCLDRIFLSN